MIFLFVVVSMILGSFLEMATTIQVAKYREKELARVEAEIEAREATREAYRAKGYALASNSQE